MRLSFTVMNALPLTR